MHQFSMTCKAESALDLFGKESERNKAIEWFKEHFISKLYIESYRHGRSVPVERLICIRDDFTAAGFEVAGCITPTMMSVRNGNALVTCYSDPDARLFMQNIVEITAGVFDLIILDDFLFTGCACKFCEQEKGDRSWSDYRSDLMLNVAKENILKPARDINSNAEIIIKYPLWYEGYRDRGYDVIRETELFDYTFIGTETREPESPEAGKRPQTQASWIQGWMNDLSNGKCGGGWYDPIDTGPQTFVEQARQTILGGARESLLHCYDYLGTTTPGVAIHGKDLEIKNGLANGEAFKGEAESLQSMAEMLSDMECRGIQVVKNPNVDLAGKPEAYLPGFIGMMGLPVLPVSSLRMYEPAFLGVQALGFDNLTAYIEDALHSQIPFLISKGFFDGLKGAARDILINAGVPAQIDTDPDNASIINVSDTLGIVCCPEDLWGLVDLDQNELDCLRSTILSWFGMELYAPSRISLHLYRSENRTYEVFENFNNHSIEIKLSFPEKDHIDRKALIVCPGNESVKMEKIDSCTFSIVMARRSMVLLSQVNR